MPPVLDALQAIFPDLLQQPVSASDEPAHTVGDTAQTPSVDVTQAYSGRITAINTKLSAALDDTTQQHRYLDAQQQQAKKADEEALAQADVDYTPGWRQAGLPIKPSHLQLDPLLVQTGGLVNPKSVISWYDMRNTKEVLSPLPVAEHNHVGADPHYCTLTSNLQVRNKLVPAKRRAEAGQGTTWRALPQEDLKARLAASAVRRKAMTQAMPKDQWDLEKRIIDSMQHKLGFLRNPRFPSPQKYSSIPKAEAGPSLALSAKSHDSRQASPNKRVRVLQQQVPFRAEPSQVLFQAHEQGQHYRQLVTLHNATLFGQRLRLLSPLSPYFSFSTLEFYQSPEQGLVAPGMHVGVTVTFTPDALHDYDDTMIIETGQGRLEVPLRARRDPPCLNLPQLIVVGPTLRANRQVLSITCSNSGGPGHFHISRECQGFSSPGDDLVQLGPFQLRPAAFALERQEQMQLQIVFEPNRIGEHSEVFVLKCNNGTQTAYHLSGIGADVHVQLGSLDGRRFTAEEAHKPIWFGEVAVGARQHRVVRVTNPTPLPLPFCWQQTDDPVSSGVQHAQRELTDGRFGAMQFHVEPAVGILEAGAETDMTLSFAPESQHRFESWAQLMVDTSVPGTAPTPCYSQRMCEVALEGYGTACAVSLWPPIIAVPGHIQLGQVVTQHLTVGNPGRAVAAVTWTSSNPAVTVEPSSAIIAAGSEQQFQACMKGSAIGQLQAQLQCLVKHGMPQAVEVTARVTGPAVQFTDPGVAFGLVQLGNQVTQTVTIQNTSRFSPATWTLHALPQQVSSSSSSSSSAAESDSAAQHAQQATDTANQGVPAVLQAKEQQLQDAAVTNQGAASEADESRFNTVAADVATAAQSEHPFAGLPAAEEEEEELGCSLVIEPECGVLVAGASATVHMQFCADAEGDFDTILELFTAGGAMSHLSVTAAVVAPSLALTPTLLDLGVTHLGVPQHRTLTLSNLTMLPTSFSWEAYGSGGGGEETGGGQLEVTLDPPHGVIEPGSQQSIHAVFTPTATGKAEVLVACCTDSISPPAGFSAVSHVKGVSVAYTVQPYPSTTPLPPPAPLATLSAQAKTGNTGHRAPGLVPDAMPEYGGGVVSQGKKPHPGRSVRADFGYCSIGDTKSLLLSISNESPIAASVNLWLDTFQADLPGAAATAAAALSQPSVMTSFGSLLPRSPTGQKSHLTQLSTAGGLSASRGQSPSPTLHLGFTAIAGGVRSPTPTLRLGSAADAQGMQGASHLGSTAGLGGSLKGSRHIARRVGSHHDNRQTLASLRLSDEAERSRPFASPMGQLMLTQRTSKAAAQQAVGDKGIAIGVGPPHGVLPPSGVFTCILTCSTDMCGEYVDTLHIQVGDLPEKKIPVHVSVTGTPLIMQLGKTLLPRFIRNPPVAEPLAQPLTRLRSRSQSALGTSPELLQQAQGGLLAGMALPFGQLLADTPTERAFFVFNTASMPMQVGWTFYRYGLPGPVEARASQVAQTAAPNFNLARPATPSIVLSVHLLVDEAAQTVSLSTTAVANPAVQPFVVTPSTAVISGNSSARFTVAFTNPDAMLHEGYLLGAQSVIAPESRVALHCTVAEENIDSAEETPALASSAAAVSHQHPAPKPHNAHAAVSLEGVSSAQVAQRPLVTCRLLGGFHPHAGPPSMPLQPLKVSLQAEVIQPYLEPEFPDATDGLRFVCHATHDPSRHPSYRQTVVLTNMHSCPLRFAVSMAGAPAGAGAGQFQVVRAACSSVNSLKGLQPKLAALPGVTVGTRSMHISKEESQDLLRLCPHEHVSVCIHYVPQQLPTLDESVSHAGTSSAALVSQPESTQSAGRADDLQDESASDQLIVTYSNGHQQAVPVHAQRLRPVLKASVTQLRFGSVHVQSPKTLEVELSNPSFVAAEWSLQLQSGSTAAAAASVSFAPGGLGITAPSPTALSGTHDAAPDTIMGQQKAGADVAFSVSPGNGVLLGRGLAMPKKQKLLVTFAPRQSGACTALLKVLLVEGQTIEIALSGEGTYSQGDEIQAQLQNI